MRELLEELQRRKDAKEDLCESCNSTGMYDGRVCHDCLGQGILLTGSEYKTLLAIANGEDDAILDRQAFDYE